MHLQISFVSATDPTELHSEAHHIVDLSLLCMVVLQEISQRFCDCAKGKANVQYSTVIVGDSKPQRQLASHRLMRVPRGPSNVPESLRSGVRAIEITTKPAVNSSSR